MCIIDVLRAISYVVPAISPDSSGWATEVPRAQSRKGKEEVDGGEDGWLLRPALSIS